MTIPANLFGENDHLVAGLVNSDFDSDATSDWINASLASQVVVILSKPAGTAGDDPSFRLQQASDAAGTGAKALNFDHLYAAVGTVGTFTKYEFTATDDVDLASVGADTTDLGADDAAALVWTTVPAENFDIDNGFTHIAYVNEGDDIGNAMLATVLFILRGLYYPRETPNRSVIA